MKSLIKKLLTHFLLPLAIGGAFFIWSLPRITSDYNFNTDELIYLERSKYWEAFKSGDFDNKIWSEWGAYDQPQLTNYVYGLVPGDRTVINASNSPCVSDQSSFDTTWSCLAGKPLNNWPAGTESLKKLVINARKFALGISSLVIASTYYLGTAIAGPFIGILAAFYLGWYSFFKNLSTMVMMDQILLLLLNLQPILSLRLFRKGDSLTSFLTLGVVTGFAVATKFNALLPAFLIYTSFIVMNIKKWKQILISTLLALTVFLSLNPFLWINPVSRLTTMVSWRLTQAENQRSSDPKSAPQNIEDRLSYSYYELLGTWDHKTCLAIPFLTLGVLGIFSLTAAQPTFGIISALSLVSFILSLPLFWNRYLLPVLPLIALSISYGLFSIPSVIKNKVRVFSITLGIIILLALFTPFMTLPFADAAILELTILLIIQGALVTISMLYGFISDKNTNRVFTKEASTLRKFSLILPVRDEAKVVGDTLTAMSKIDYPKDKYEILIPIRADDYETIKAINKKIPELPNTTITIIPIDGDANTKPYSLNIGFHFATGDIIGVFDAEDEPHPDLLRRINQEFTVSNYSAIQAPVQLINVNSSWYSALNSLEYFFWFRSVLPYLSRFGVIPLGGNTIFIKKEVLNNLGGWDENCLTEDADLGIRLCSAGYQIGIVSDARLATLEETPSDELGIVKQRSRWDQGYLQVLSKKSWVALSLKNRLLTAYILVQPIFRHLAFINMLVSPLIGKILNVNLAVSLLSFIPTYFLLMQWGMYLLGLYTLSRDYNFKVNFSRYFAVILFFYPYQALLSLGSFRAMGKIILGNNTWDKTTHDNLHRALYT